MLENVKVYCIMIASPGDVIEEREVVRKAIHMWNSNNSEKTHVMLRDLSWEKDSSRGVAEDAQSIIDDTVLEKSDMVIGIFWQKLGRKSQKDISYTVGEIKDHIKKGKQAFIYFKNPGEATDAATAKEIQRVLEFKENLKKELGKEVLYSEFTNVSDFDVYPQLEKDIDTYVLKKIRKQNQQSFMESLFDVVRQKHVFEYRDCNTIHYEKTIEIVAKVSGVRYVTGSFSWNAGGKVEISVANKKQKIVDVYNKLGRTYYTVRLDRDTIAGNKYTITTFRDISGANHMSEQFLCVPIKDESIGKLDLQMIAPTSLSINDLKFERFGYGEDSIPTFQKDLKLDDFGVILIEVDDVKLHEKCMLSWTVERLD